MEWVLLINCRDEVEASMIMGVLKEEDIPTMERYSGAGGYMKILSGMGKNVDIMVLSSHYERAMDIVEALQQEVEVENPSP